MVMSDFYGKIVGDLSMAIGIPIGYLLAVLHVMGRKKDLPDCFASNDNDETTAIPADLYDLLPEEN